METNERRRLTIIEFVNDKKVTFDEAKFYASDSNGEWIMVRRNDDDEIIFKTKWDKILYIRTGVIEKISIRKKRQFKNQLAEPTEVTEE